jgi:uncharacterized protein YecT (DUF1311 family)
VGGLLLPISARAANFNCSQAKSTLEVLICGDTALSSLDGQMGEAYYAVRSMVSKDDSEAAGLLGEQREFLKNRTEICPIPVNLVQSKEASRIVTCLKGFYTLRVDELQKRLATFRSQNAPLNNIHVSTFADNLFSPSNISSLGGAPAFAAFDYSFTKNGPIQGIVKWYDFSVSKGIPGRCVLHYSYRFGGSGSTFGSPCQCWVKEEIGSIFVDGINLDDVAVEPFTFAGGLYGPGSESVRGALHIPVGPRVFSGSTTCEGPAGYVLCGVVRPSQFEGPVSVDVPFKDIDAAREVMSAFKQAVNACEGS